jgi:hypothetical protein
MILRNSNALRASVFSVFPVVLLLPISQANKKATGLVRWLVDFPDGDDWWLMANSPLP